MKKTSKIHNNPCEDLFIFDLLSSEQSPMDSVLALRRKSRSHQRAFEYACNGMGMDTEKDLTEVRDYGI